jgi:hypothetical protein
MQGVFLENSTPDISILIIELVLSSLLILIACYNPKRSKRV